MTRQRRHPALQILGTLTLGATFALAACNGTSDPDDPGSTAGDDSREPAQVFVPVQGAGGSYVGEFRAQAPQAEAAAGKTGTDQDK